MKNVYDDSDTECWTHFVTTGSIHCVGGLCLQTLQHTALNYLYVIDDCSQLMIVAENVLNHAQYYVLRREVGSGC